MSSRQISSRRRRGEGEARKRRRGNEKNIPPMRSRPRRRLRGFASASLSLQASRRSLLNSHLVTPLARPRNRPRWRRRASSCARPRLDDALWRGVRRLVSPPQRSASAAAKRGETRNGGARGSVIGRSGWARSGSTWRCAVPPGGRERDARRERGSSARFGTSSTQSAAAKRSTRRRREWSAPHTDDVLISTPTDAEARGVRARRAAWATAPAPRPGTTCSLASGCSYREVLRRRLRLRRVGARRTCATTSAASAWWTWTACPRCAASARAFGRMLDEGAEGFVTAERTADAGASRENRRARIFGTVLRNRRAASSERGITPSSGAAAAGVAGGCATARRGRASDSES